MTRHTLYATLELDVDAGPQEFRFVFDHTPAFGGSIDWPEQDDEFDLVQVCVKQGDVGRNCIGELLISTRQWFGSHEGQEAAAEASIGWLDLPFAFQEERPAQRRAA
jgi:hypothetical protein